MQRCADAHPRETPSSRVGSLATLGPQAASAKRWEEVAASYPTALEGKVSYESASLVTGSRLRKY